MLGMYGGPQGSYVGNVRWPTRVICRECTVAHKGRMSGMSGGPQGSYVENLRWPTRVMSGMYGGPQGLYVGNVRCPTRVICRECTVAHKGHYVKKYKSKTKKLNPKKFFKIVPRKVINLQKKNVIQN